MKRSLLLTLMAIAGTAILAVALVGFRLSQGGLDYSAFAHIYDYDGDTSNDFHTSLDADVGNGICDPVDDSVAIDVETLPQPVTHEVAICIESAPDSVSAFSVIVNYDDSLNTCPEVDCAGGDAGTKCEDDNPDANAGATLGSGVPTTPDLGTGWDCSGFGLIEPTCTGGAATIDCLSMMGPYTSSTGDVGFPLAVVTFVTTGTVGLDSLSLASVVIGDTAGAEMGSCNPVVGLDMPCEGADVDKVPAPTPEPGADLEVTKSDDVDPVTLGDNVVYTITVTNNPPVGVGHLDAENAVLVDTLPDAKVYVADSASCDAGSCSEVDNVVTCNLGTIAKNASVVCTLTATADAVGTHTNVATVTSDAPEFNAADNTAEEDTTEVSAGVRMEKDANVLEEGVQSTANLWIMAEGCVVPEEGKGCLVIEKWVFNAVDVDSPNDSDEDPEGVGAWEEQIKYEHKIVDVLATPDNTWLESGGRIANCTMTILTENWILTGCVTKDDPEEPGIQPGPGTGPDNKDGLIETILVSPDTNDLIYRDGFRPTKDNGVLTDIVDENCEVTDTLAEQIPGTLPGGLTVNCTDVHLTVRMLQGDLDLDCDVDVVDDQAIAFRYGSFFGLQLYDQWFDLEPKYADFDIDIKDLQFVFGRNYSTCQAPIPDDQAIPLDPPQP